MYGCGRRFAINAGVMIPTSRHIAYHSSPCIFRGSELLCKAVVTHSELEVVCPNCERWCSKPYLRSLRREIKEFEEQNCGP